MTITKAQAWHLHAYVVDHAADHEDACPGDDTCECSFHERNKAVSDVVKALIEDSHALAALPSEPPALVALRQAWEAGFTLCRSYGDNHHHFDGEQKERRWLEYVRAIDAGDVPPLPTAAPAPDVLSASEALYAFGGWLTVREEPMTLSARHNAAPIAERIGEFCKAYALADPREGWDRKVRKMPGGFDPASALAPSPETVSVSREDLASIEWVLYVDARRQCPACLALRRNGKHAPNCWIGAALSPPSTAPKGGQ